MPGYTDPYKNRSCYSNVHYTDMMLNYLAEFAIKYHKLNKKFMSFTTHAATMATHNDVNGITRYELTMSITLVKPMSYIGIFPVMVGIYILSEIL